MPIRIPVNTIIVQREGKQFAVPLNKPFDFTKEELADIKNLRPNAVRLPVQETAPIVSKEAEAAAEKAAADKAAADKAEADKAAAAAAKTGAGSKPAGGKPANDGDL